MASRRVRSPWAVGAAFAGVMLVLGLGCSDDGTGPGQPPRISIVPDQVALYIGDTVTVRATIRNSAHPEVRYSSSAPELVEVDELTGLATARAAGEATVSAVSAIDPRINAHVAVTVVPDLPAAVTVADIRAADGGEVDVGAISGALKLQLEVTAGNAHRLEVRLGEEVVCGQEYAPPPPGTAPAAPATLSCLFGTATFNAQDGTPLFLNGVLPLVARLMGSGDRELASSDPQDLTLSNPSILAGTVRADRSAVDASGETWLGGDLTVTAVPVLHDQGAVVDAITFAYRTPAGDDTTATDTAAPFHVTLAADAILTAVTDPALRVALTSVDAEGAAGPNGTTAAIRFDGMAPTPGTLAARDWVGAQTRFVDTYSAESESDAGVGRVYVDFFAGDPALTPEALITAGTPVILGSDLPQAAAGTYQLVARVCDGLDNCTLQDGYLFGVDLTPPIVESVSLSDHAANPGADMLVGVRDDLSGFPDRLLEVTVQLLDASPGTAACGPTVEAVDLPGKPLGAGCAPDTVANPVRVPRTTAGYYSYSLVAFDRAGNRSSQIDRSILVDLQAPHIGAITVPTPLQPGGNFTATVPLGDDVEIVEADFALVFASPSGGVGVAIPFTAPSALGVPFDGVLVTGADASATLPFVRTLTFGGASSVGRATVLIDSIRATARDAAALTAASARALAPTEYGGDTSTADPFQRFSSAITFVDRNAVCTGGCTAEDPKMMRISARVEGESGTGLPFAQIHFYRRGASGRLVHIGTRAGGDATITNAGNRSTYVYTLDHTPPALLSGEFGIVAVGVNSRGNALSTSLPTAPTVTFYSR